MKPTEVHAFNVQQLKNNGTSGVAQPAYKTVRNVGDLQKATIWDGTEVERKDHIWVEGHGLIKCCPYELHFVYEVKTYGWGLYCTCGSIAGVVGARAYRKLIAPSDTGLMVVCIRHTTTKDNTGVGKHADESTE